MIVLLISDIVLGFKESGFNTDNILYDGWFWVYLAFIVAVFFGEKIANHIRFTTILMAWNLMIYIFKKACCMIKLRSFLYKNYESKNRIFFTK